MAGKKKIYEALLDGASAGLGDGALYAHVMERCPKATSKKIVRASLLALTDPDLRDANILHVIYALAIKHRLDPVSEDDGDDDEEDASERETRKKTKGTRRGKAEQEPAKRASK